MAKAGTGGQTNVTQSDSTGNQKMDISPIDNINNDMSLDDIAGVYTNLGHQYEGIASKAAADVGRRQTELIGNDFGAVNAYNYNQYYEPGANSFQSSMRMQGTQRALEEGMDRAKKEAQAKVAAAQNNYNNAQSALDNLEKARKEATLVYAGEVGGNTSASELLKYIESLNAENAEELNRDVSAHYLSDELVGGAWDIKAYRDNATAQTLAKFGVSKEDYDKFSQEEHDAFWARGDVGDYWTNKYAYQYAKDTYGEQVANDYQAAYEWNYAIVKDVFDQIKSGADQLSMLNDKLGAFVTGIKVAKVSGKRDVEWTGSDVKVEYDAKDKTIKIDETTYTFDNSDEAKKGTKDEQGRASIYSLVDDAHAKEISNRLRDLEKTSNYSSGNPFLKQTEKQDADRALSNFESYMRMVAKDNSKFKGQKLNEDRNITFDYDNSQLSNLLEGAFGADMESINYLMNLSATDPQKYEDLIHDYSLVLTYGQVFEIADGQKVYHTIEGDKVLEAGTYVMYTLPGMADANGDIIEPNLKRFMQLRSEEFSADMDEEKLQEEMNKCLDGYQKVVTAALFLAAGSDCDTTTDIVHSAIFASAPTDKSALKGVIYGNHTVDEIINKFNELANNDGEKAYSLFTKIVKKASSVAGSMMANYGGKLTTVDTKDKAGRDMVGSELTSSKDANTLFTEGDIDNLTVSEATALWTVIGTAIDRYNKGNTASAIKSDFLTADGLNWFNEFGIETVKGVAGIVDLVGNLAWTGGASIVQFFKNIFSGKGAFETTQEEYDAIFKNGRWWGTGGITGNWSGNASIYDQFVGDYKENAFGYGESNQSRMTDNLNHLITPIVEDMWFSDDYSGSQAAMGAGRASDEGLNYRSMMHFTSSMAGLVASVVAGNAIAKGVGTISKWGADLAKSAAKGAAAKIKGKFASSALSSGLHTASELLDGASTAAGAVSTSPVDDITRVASNYTDDAARAVTNNADDVARAATNNTDDVSNVLDRRAIAPSRESELSEAGKLIQERVNFSEAVTNAFADSADDATRALGAAATSVTRESIEESISKITEYSKEVFKSMMGKNYNEGMLDDLMKYFGKKITKDSLGMAHVSMYSGIGLDELANMSSESIALVSNLAHLQMGGAVKGMTGEAKQLATYLQSMSRETLTDTIRDIVDRATIRANAKGIWTMDDTIRALARNGWDSKRLSLLAKDWFKNQIQDISTDILYGYIKPTVTNEGTDRETIDEYLTNPLNYIMNLGASGLQFFGGRVLNKANQTITNHALERAQKALQIADNAKDSAAIQRKSKKVLKLVDKANSLADKALERGKPLQDVKEITDECNSYADNAIRAMTEDTIRNMDDATFGAKITNFNELSNALNNEDMGMLRNLFYAYNGGTVKANANYFVSKRMLNTYNGGLGSIVEQSTNGKIWKTLFEGRRKALAEMHIPQGEVTLAQQKKIYKRMVDEVMNLEVAKTIPGLRNSLNNYFNTLIDMASTGEYDKFRAGYMPIESMLNTNKDVSAGIRGFSNGSWVLDSESANPYLERSEALSDEAIVDAILNGDKEIQLKDADGNLIVDADGNIETRALNADGLNFLDSITNAINAKTFHDYIDPIVGKNGEYAGSQALKNAYIVINQPGAMKEAFGLSMKADRKAMQDIENAIFQTPAEKADLANTRKAIETKANQIANANPRIKKAVAKKTAAKQLTEERITTLRKQKTELTRNQSQHPAVVMGYIDANGVIDSAAGKRIFDYYSNVVKDDIRKFQNGEIEVGGVIKDKYRRFDKFSWQYGKDKTWGAAVPGYTQDVPVTSEYYAMLSQYVNSGLTEPPKDMVMSRMLDAQITPPLDKDGNLFKSVNAKTKTSYEWTSPIQYFRSSYVGDDALSNMELRAFQRRGSMGDSEAIGGWFFKEKGKNGRVWTEEDFSKLKLDSPENVALAKEVVAANLARRKVVPTNKDGSLNKTAKDMLDSATSEAITAAKMNPLKDANGNLVFGSDALYFDEYVDILSRKLANTDIFMGAFDETSAYNNVFRDLNTYKTYGGVGYDEFYDFLDDKIRALNAEGKDASDYVAAWAIWDQLDKHDHRAVGMGDDWSNDRMMPNNKPDADTDNDSVDLFNNSEEAVAANSNPDMNPEAFARRNEIREKGIEAAEATSEEADMAYDGRYTEQYGDKMKEIDIFSTVLDNQENFTKSLASFKKIFGDFVNTDMIQERIKKRNEVANLIDGYGNKKGLIAETNDIINAAAKINKSVENQIKAYAGQRQHRQKRYGVNSLDSKYDALKAFGATDSGYTVTQTPSQLRAASRNVSLYDANKELLEPLKQDFINATDSYNKMLKNRSKYSEKQLLQAQGLVDETRKRLANKMEDVDIDLTGDFSHGADRSGYSLDYDRMMLEGGTMEGRVDQSIAALVQVRTFLEDNPFNDTTSNLINKIDTQINKLSAAKEQIPYYERLSMLEQTKLSDRDSFELAMTSVMSEVGTNAIDQPTTYRILPDGTQQMTAAGATNGMFSDEMLNSLVGYEHHADKTGGGRHRLQYSIDENGKGVYKRTVEYDRGKTTFDFGTSKKGNAKYKNASLELSGVNVDDPDARLDINITAGGKEYDIANAPAEEIVSLNQNAFENKYSNIRIAILDESTGTVEKPLTKEFSYGKDQPEFEKLTAANDKAQAILKYKEAQAKNPKQVKVKSGDYEVMRDNTNFKEGLKDVKSLAKELKLTDSDLRKANNISLEDARTDAWISNAELDKFKQSHSEGITEIKSDVTKKLEDLRAREKETTQRVAEAREFGDLSENEEYHAARRELAQIKDQIAEIEEAQKAPSKAAPSQPVELSEAERSLLVSRDDVKTVGETYGKYTIVELADDNFTNDTEAPMYDRENYSLQEARDAAYTEWLAFSKDEESIQKALDAEIEKAKKSGKKIEKESDEVIKEKVADPDDASKTVSFEEYSDDGLEKKIKELGTEKQYKEWKAAKNHLDYTTKLADQYNKDKNSVLLYRDRNGAVYLGDNSPNIANYASGTNQLNARGYKPLKSKEDVPEIDAKADKAARKEMNKNITKNRHSGDVFESRLEEFELPKDKNGNYILDSASKNATIANIQKVFEQVKQVTGLKNLSYDGILMNNEYADLLTRIAGESVEAGKLQGAIGALSNFAQSIQNVQLAGGASWVNALSLAQLRGAIMQNPRKLKEYIQVVGSMRNSMAVANFAQDNLPLLSRFVMEIGDASIVNDFGAAIATRPGVEDGGVLQNMITNGLNLRKDWIDAKVKADGNIPKAFKALVSKDIQNTIFEDATFKNAMPVLRAKMLIENYDAAISKLKAKFPDADAAILDKAALQMSYAKTKAFFDPYHAMGRKTATQALDNTFAKNMRDFAATFVNAKSQTTILDTLTNFFFALRYKMMLSGRVYAGAASVLPRAKGAIGGRAIKELTEDTFDSVMDTMGTSFMNSGSMAGIGSLAACAVTAAASAAALGIPTAWDDISWIDEYDGSFKIPDVLLKFQTIGQIWLPNAYSEERGLYVDPNKSMYGLDTMSSIFTLQNSLFRTVDRSINPETYYAAPQRGIIGSASSQDAINQFLNAPVPRAIGDELIGSNLLSPFKAMYEVIMDSTYFGNNIWEKRKLPDGRDNPNYDPGRNIAAMTMHLLGLDQVLDGGKGYNGWVKGQGTAKYVEQDQIGTVKGSGILQHEFLTAAIDMIDGKYIEAIYGAGELPVKAQNLSSKARTEFNTRVKNIIAGYNDEYKAIATSVDSTNADKDAAFKDYAKKTADAVATWSKKYEYALGQNQELVPYVARTAMAMLSGEYDDNMYYVQDAYWKASATAQIEGVTANNYWLDDDDLKDWIAQGKSSEEFAKEKEKRTRAYNEAQDDEYEARKALLEANRDADDNELIKGLEGFLTDRYSYSDLKAEQRAVNKEIFTSIHSKLDMPVGEFDNYKEMKTYYEKLIEGQTSKNKKVDLAMRYNTYVFDLLAPYAEKYGANIVNDGYFNGKGLANDLADYVILPADKNYGGKSPVSNYIKDVFNVGYRNGDALPSDKEVYERFITAQNLAMKGAVSSSLAILDGIIDAMKKGRMFVSDADYSRIINMRAVLSARSK